MAQAGSRGKESQYWFQLKNIDRDESGRKNFFWKILLPLSGENCQQQ
jgi:hypothetical protein